MTSGQIARDSGERLCARCGAEHLATVSCERAEESRLLDAYRLTLKRAFPVSHGPCYPNAFERLIGRSSEDA